MLEDQVVISGIGKSPVGRRLGIDPWDLTATACLAAIRDAGLSVEEIDGLSTYPGAVGSTPGISGAGTDDVRALLGLRLRWHTGGLELPGQLGALVNAMSAVASGLVEHVLCFRTVWESSAQEAIGNRSATLSHRVHRDSDQWGKPYGVAYPTYGALMMQRYMHESDATREQIAQVALTARANAALTDDAPYRQPMSLDDYMSARMISEPLCLYDCDVPIDGSVAVVVSTTKDTAMSRGRSIPVRAIGSASGMEESGQMLWSRTDLRPADVKAAHLYDGFSVLALKWMEALQLCPSNESGRFVEGGERIARDGILPVNTGGGQLSGGRLHGFGGLYEACLQARGEAGARQVVPVPSASIISSGTSTFSSCMLIGSAFDLP